MSRNAWVRLLAQAVLLVAAAALGGVLAVSLGGGGGGGGGGAVPTATLGERAPQTQAVSGTLPQPAEAGAAAATSPSLADVVADVRRSVVVITAVSSASHGRGGEGTGLVVDQHGHILTNYHVVEGADDLMVRFYDGTTAVARLLGADQDNDLAVLQVLLQPQQLVPVRFADSSAVREGDSVFAIGNPFSFGFTVTRGIVSGLGRESSSNSSGRAIRGVIQTDAAVNPGNSGGPLFNLRGEVVGVNNAIHNPTGQRVWVGVGFAIPSNTAQRYLPDMIAGREIRHPQLGLSGLTLDDVNAPKAGLSVTRGAYVTAVVAGSAAERAGLRAAAGTAAAGSLPPSGDVVVSVNGTAVTSMQQLARLIDEHNIGDQVTLAVVRGGQRLSLTATLLEWRR
ncbi:MAG: trypsin-like serine protease [Dehalococcoidia bacterium]|nr:trypsin-like serine protease [Dehalococcoidia bacterium]